MMQHHRTVLLGGAALVFMTLGGCGSAGRQLGYARLQIAEQERALADLEAQIAAKDAEIAELRRRGVEVKPIGPVGPSLPAPGSTGEISTSYRDQDLVLTISNEILFRPGSAVLSDKAKQVLDQAVGMINAQHRGHLVRVEGHTDSQPIKRSKDKWEDNWDLSGGRALAVLQYLQGHGIHAKQLGFAGYGMERPRVPNTSPANMSQNRRVEIIVITNKTAENLGADDSKPAHKPAHKSGK